MYGLNNHALDTEIAIRRADRDDVKAIVEIIADNPIGQKRESIGEDIDQRYYEAFDLINEDPKQILIVAEFEGNVVGTMQISFLVNMSVRGSKRALIEAMHVCSRYRNHGIGHYMMNWAISEAKARGCRIVQLTSNKERLDAHRFYKDLGFKATHEGFKLQLES